MSQDFIFALGLLMLAALVIAVGANSLWQAAKNKSVITTIKIPWVGEVKTNVPAIALTFCGVVIAGYANKTMTVRGPTLVNFHVNVEIDHDAKDVEAVMVGVTSDYWSRWVTPTSNSFSVDIAVPNSWQAYSFFAISPGNRVRPYVIGTSLEKHEATLPLLSTTPKKILELRRYP